MSLSYKILRRWHVFKIRFQSKVSSKLDFHGEPLNNEQQRAIEIAKKVIVDEDSKLYYSHVRSEDGVPEAGRYLIENGHLVIKITHGKIRIINGKYKYDVSFRNEDKTFQGVKRLFAKSIAHRLDKLEAQINARIEKSLDHILDELKENE